MQRGNDGAGEEGGVWLRRSAEQDPLAPSAPDAVDMHALHASAAFLR
jgi:hypothetical protein